MSTIHEPPQVAPARLSLTDEWFLQFPFREQAAMLLPPFKAPGERQGSGVDQGLQTPGYEGLRLRNG
jgi:hypothetical protein